VESDLRYYMDYTGTGNSLNVRYPHTVRLIMDSLRYWELEMHVRAATAQPGLHTAGDAKSLSPADRW
jgi:hypothetical protein